MKGKPMFAYIFVGFIIYSCSSHSNIHLPGSGSPGYLIINSTACYFQNSEDSVKGKKIAIYFPTVDQQKKINEITTYIGLPQNLLLLSGNIKGVIACVIENRNIVLFDKNMFSLTDSALNYWSDYYMLSHAIGHHLSNHFYQSSIDFKSAELEADKFAGATLYRLGANIPQSITGLQHGKLSNLTDNKDTLSLSSRITTVKQGYDDASNQFIYQLATPPPPATGPNMNLKTEFKIGDFADDSLESHLSVTYDSAGVNYEGIVTTTSTDGEEIDPGDELPPSTVIEITKADTGSDVYGVGQRINLTFPELKYDTPKQKKDRKNYLAMLRRGTKLKFRFYFYKYFNNIYYVKYLPR